MREKEREKERERGRETAKGGILRIKGYNLPFLPPPASGTHFFLPGAQSNTYQNIGACEPSILLESGLQKKDKLL